MIHATPRILLLSVACLILETNCQDACKDELRRCLKNAPMNVAAGLPTSLEQVDSLCRAYKVGMDCVETYNKDCMPAETRKLAEKHMASAKFFMTLLCDDPNFKKEYLNYTECFSGVSGDWNRCHSNYLEAAKEVDKTPHARPSQKTTDICCARYGFNRCISLASRAKCDRNAAIMLRRISETLSHNDMCERFENSICSATSNHTTNVQLLVLACFIILMKIRM